MIVRETVCANASSEVKSTARRTRACHVPPPPRLTRPLPSPILAILFISARRVSYIASEVVFGIDAGAQKLLFAEATAVTNSWRRGVFQSCHVTEYW